MTNIDDKENSLIENEKVSMPEKWGQGFTSWLDRITYICLIISGILILLMAIIGTYGALKRYIFVDPDPFSYVLTCVLMLLAAVMSLSGVQTLRQHISVDFITNRLPAAAQEFIKNIFGPLLGVVFSGLIVYSSWNEAMFALHANEKTITGLKILTFPYKLAIPIFVGLLTLVLIVQITRYIISLGNRRRR